MKGYVFLDADHILVYKNSDYIDFENPYFWEQNRESIVWKWKFDTDDINSLVYLFRKFKDYLIPPTNVKEFCTSIGISPTLVKDYLQEQRNAGKIQPNEN